MNENFKDEKIKEEENEDVVGSDTENTSAPGDTLTPSQSDEGGATDEEGINGTENMENDNAAGSDVESQEEDVIQPEESAVQPEESSVQSEESAVQPEKTFTQAEVNALVGKVRQEGRQAGREEALKELLERYGVLNDVELNDVFGKGQAYDGLNDDYQNQGNLYRDAMTENALLKSNVTQDRWDDIKAILAGKNLDVTVENIEAMIPTHPEWRGATKVLTPEAAEDMAMNINSSNETDSKPAVLKKLGSGISTEIQETDEQKARRLFGL